MEVKIYNYTLPLAVITSLLSGCASIGVEQLKTETQASVDSKIVKGKSTKSDISAAFGDPTNTTFTDSGNEIWKYTYTLASPKASNFVPVVNWFTRGQNIDKRELAILFDKNAIVQNYTFSASKQELYAGIVPQ